MRNHALPKPKRKIDYRLKKRKIEQETAKKIFAKNDMRISARFRFNAEESHAEKICLNLRKGVAHDFVKDESNGTIHSSKTFTTTLRALTESPIISHSYPKSDTLLRSINRVI